MEPTIKIAAAPPSATSIVTGTPPPLSAPIPVIRLVIGVIPTIHPAIIPIAVIRITIAIVRVAITGIRLRGASTQGQKSAGNYPVRDPDHLEHLTVENRHGQSN
jgi:hypothetical protein